MENETQKKTVGTSSAPVVLGIIGGVLNLPASLCSAACAGGMTGMVTEDVEEAEELAAAAASSYMGLGIIAGIVAIVFACLSKKHWKLSGIVLLIAAILSLFTAGTTFNVLGIISAILILIGAVLCFTQKKEEV